ncbi:MAG TPA: TerC family protein [Planctomycetaceae bacterium]|jgi:tellurite resistance protein TerC|nr:TerC family protein [Planctomycetaceae bacterium]
MGWLWVGFIGLIGALLALDLGVFHRKAHVIPVREALLWSAAWVGLALGFSAFVYFCYERHWFGMDLPYAEHDGASAAIAFLTGYVVEKSLSIDNLCVIALIFGYLGVPAANQHRVLFWGILAALLMRGAMIFVGSLLIEQFHWVLYVFGVLLIVAAIRMFFERQESGSKGEGFVRFARRLVPVTDQFFGQRFFVRLDNRLMLTPLALALIAVESADLLFAADSIPAIFAITEDRFLVFTSNVFAILGLRSLYFALAHVIDRFHYLNRALAAILALIGFKLVFKDVLHGIPGLTYYMLAAIALLVGLGIVASLLLPKPPVAQPDMATTERPEREITTQA